MAIIKKHLNPVWEPLATSIVQLSVDILDENAWEELPSRDVGDRRFVICCIPFFVRNLALGDEVQVDDDAQDTPVFLAVTRESGFYCYRVWLYELEWDPGFKRRHELIYREMYERLGCPLESYSDELIGIAAPSISAAEAVVDWLELQEQEGTLDWEAANE